MRKADNIQRKQQYLSMAFILDDFIAVYERYGITHNQVLRFLLDKGEQLLEAERTGFSRIIAEKDKEIERLKKDSDRYRKLRRMHCNEFQNIYVASLNGNRSFDELVDGIQTFC